MSTSRYRSFVGAMVVVGSVAAACGGVDEGRVNIVDEAGGNDSSDAGEGNGGSGGSAGKAPGAGGDVSDQAGAGGASGSGGSGGEGGDGTGPVLPEPPVVVSITPDNGDDQVEPTDSIRIEFSEGLDPDSVTGDSVLVFDGETAISGELDYSGVTVEFIPDQRLDLLGDYSVVVTTDITDAEGTPMAADYSSSFTVRDGAWREELLVENAQGAINRLLVSPVIDANGNALMIWGQAKSGQTVGSVFGRYFSPDQGFGKPFEIDTTDVACDDLSVGMNAAGQAIVAWTEKRGTGEEVWARRISAGTLDGPASRVAVAPVNVSGTVSAVSATDEAHVLWSFNDSATGGTKQNILANHAKPAEAWLSTPEILYNYVESLSTPAVAFDDDGNGFVFFAFDSDSSDPPGRLYARRYLVANGQWRSGTVIGGSDRVRQYYAPDVVTDANGGARALFAASDENGVEDVKVVTFTKAGGFGAAQVIDVLDISPNSSPKISSNGSRFLAAWYQSVSLTTNAYSSLSDGGAFAAPQLRSSGDFPVGYYGNAVTGLDRRGNGLVLFEQGNAASSVDIVFGRLSANGDEWADAAPVNSLEGEYQDPRLAVAANGVAVAAWSVGIRLSANSIYVTTFD